MENNIKELINHLSGIETVFYILELNRQKYVDEIFHIDSNNHNEGYIFTLMISFDFRTSVKGFEYWDEIVQRLKYNDGKQKC
jgi:hypothetical protein